MRNTRKITIFTGDFSCLTIMFYTNIINVLVVCTDIIVKRRALSSITLKHHVIRQLFNIIQASRKSSNTQMVRCAKECVKKG